MHYLLQTMDRHHDGGGGNVAVKHIQHPDGDSYFVHLASNLHGLHSEGLFHDTVIHYKDGTVSMNRLLTVLLFPRIDGFLGCSDPDNIDVVFPDVHTEELDTFIANFFEVKDERSNFGEYEESDSIGEGFESDFVKAELKECSPSPENNIGIEVKEECVDIIESPKPKFKWSCYICKESFKRAEHLSAHALAQHNTDRPYQCSFCQFTSREKGQLMRHENTHTRATQFSCDICGKTFLDSRDLRVHKTVHSDERNMQCEYCDKCFKSDLYLNRHIKLMHSNNPVGEFKCEICQKLFKTKDYLNRHHRKVHSNPIYYVCSFCGKNFKSASHRKDHEEIHRGEADAKCEICGAQVRKKNLERHMKTHSDEADFTCDICAKPLKTIEAFRAHMNSHELPFKCEFCDRAFSTKYSMKSHTVQQHLLKKETKSPKSKESKPMYKCNQCGYQCTTSKYMKTHKAVKHDGLVHKCTECNFTTGDTGSLRSHKRAKHDGIVFSCDQCDFKSGYKNNLKNHKAVAHFTVDGLGAFASMSKPIEEVSHQFDDSRRHWMDTGNKTHTFPFSLPMAMAGMSKPKNDVVSPVEDNRRYWMGNNNK